MYCTNVLPTARLRHESCPTLLDRYISGDSYACGCRLTDPLPISAGRQHRDRAAGDAAASFYGDDAGRAGAGGARPGGRHRGLRDLPARGGGAAGALAGARRRVTTPPPPHLPSPRSAACLVVAGSEQENFHIFGLCAGRCQRCTSFDENTSNLPCLPDDVESR